MPSKRPGQQVFDDDSLGQNFKKGGNVPLDSYLLRALPVVCAATSTMKINQTFIQILLVKFQFCYPATGLIDEEYEQLRHEIDTLSCFLSRFQSLVHFSTSAQPSSVVRSIPSPVHPVYESGASPRRRRRPHYSGSHSRLCSPGQLGSKDWPCEGIAFPSHNVQRSNGRCGWLVRSTVETSIPPCLAFLSDLAMFTNTLST